ETEEVTENLFLVSCVAFVTFRFAVLFRRKHKIKSLPVVLCSRTNRTESLEGNDVFGVDGLRVAAHDVRRLQPLGTFQQFELNHFAFIQGAVAVLLDHGKMDEYVLASGALDESVSLGSVEPLHCTLLFGCTHANSFRLESKSPPMVPLGWLSQMIQRSELKR